MKVFIIGVTAVFVAGGLLAQTPENSNAQIAALTKKVDEINTKLDALSQKLLKMEQQSGRPGVMIGETTPANTPVPVAAATSTTTTTVAATGNSHVVAKGETLTAIAKQYKVSVEDLQKYNHIEDGRKLQAGQTVMIPPASPAATASP